MRGQRAILITQVPEYIKGLEFNKKKKVSGVFNAPFSITPNAERNSSDLVVPVFNPSNYVVAPNGATHFRLINAIGAISDYSYNSVTKSYEPIDEALNSLINISYTAYLDVNTPLAADLSLTASFTGAPEMSADVTVANVLGIEFYQEVNGDYYLLNSGHAAKVESTF